MLVVLEDSEATDQRRIPRGSVARDGGKCVICGEAAADAHHIIERRLWTDGGYYLENGASLCSQHHVEAEMTVLSCDEIRSATGITCSALPAHFDRSERYVKTANVYLLGTDSCAHGSATTAIYSFSSSLDSFLAKL